MLSQLAPFVLPTLVRSLLADRGAVLRPVVRGVRGVAVCIDIAALITTSGAHRIIRVGPPAAVSHALNPKLGTIIAQLEAEGAEICKLNATRIEAIFVPANLTQQTPTDACQRAWQAVQTLKQRFETDPDMPIRIAIASGDLYTLQLGGSFNRWHFLMTGPALWAAATALSEQSGFAVCSPAFAAMLPLEPISPRPLAQPHYSSVDDHGPEIESIRRFLPRPVLDWTQHGLDEWFVVCRPLTVLNIGIRGLPAGKNHALATIHPLTRVVQESLAEAEGTLVSLDFDGNELRYLAVFGLPPLGRDEDPQQAISCCQRLVQQFADHEVWQTEGLHCAFGIASGPVFAGPLGTPSLSAYTLVGQPATAAGALMRRAGDGEILCDAETHRLARGSFGFDMLRQPSGDQTSSHTVYRPYGALRERSSGRLVGRMSERAAFAEQLTQLRQGGPGGVMLVEGEAGVGKSTLLRELVRTARRSGVFVLSGAGTQRHQRSPYQVLTPMLCELLSIDPQAPPSQQRKRAKLSLSELAEHVGEGYPELAQHATLLNDILPLGLPPTRHSQLLDGGDRAACTRLFLIELVRWGVTRGFSCLAVDNCQWLDSLAWSLILALVDNVEGMLFVLVATPETRPNPILKQLKSLPATSVLRLRGMSPQEITNMVCQGLGVGDLPPSLQTMVRARSDGLPLLSEAFTAVVRGEGLVAVENGVCTVKSDLERTLLPRNPREIIARRLDQLTPEQRSVLQTASVVGFSFELAELEEVHLETSKRTQIAPILVELENLGLTTEVESGSGQTYRFHHELSQQLAYRLLTPERRQALHRQVGELLERTCGETPTHSLEQLAYHWREAGYLWKYIDYRERFGAQALRLGAFAEASLTFAELLELSHGDLKKPLEIKRLRRARWEWQLARAQTGLELHVEARSNLLHALSLLGRPLPPATRVGSAGLVKQLAIQLKHRAFHRRNRRVRGNRDKLEAALAVYRDLIELDLVLGSAESIPYCALALLNAAEQLGAGPAIIAQASCYLGHVAAVAGLGDISNQYARLAKHHLKTLSDHPSSVGLVTALAQHHAGHGRFDAAEALLDPALARHPCRTSGSYHDMLAARIQLDLLRGRFAAAQERMVEQQALAGRDPNSTGTAWSLTWKLTTDLLTGELDDAETQLQQALALYAGPQHPTWHLRFLAFAARLAIRRGRFLYARDCVKRGLDSSTYVRPLTFLSLPAHLEFSRVAISLWEIQPTRDNRGLARAACKHLRKLARVFPVSLATAWLWRGIYNWKAGHPSRARRSWSQAIERATHLEMYHAMGQIDLEVGRRIGGPEGLTQLKRAYARFKTMGAEHELLQVHSLLVELGALEPAS